MGLIQSVEGLNRKKQTFPEEEGILPADHLQTPTETLPCVVSLLFYSTDLGLASLQYCVNQFLKINESLFLPFFRSYWFWFSREPSSNTSGTGYKTKCLLNLWNMNKI